MCTSERKLVKNQPLISYRKTIELGLVFYNIKKVKQQL